MPTAPSVKAVLQIVEEPSWKEAADIIGGLRNVDEALEPIIEALSKNPAGFPEIDPVNLPGIRLAKTDQILRDGDLAVPALRVWFRYRVGDERVGLLFAEPNPGTDED